MAFWQNQSFHNYADYAMGEDFLGAPIDGVHYFQLMASSHSD
jgi:hypothetical protein